MQGPEFFLTRGTYGVYEVEDWIKIDERANRFRPLLNDEFGHDFLGELVD